MTEGSENVVLTGIGLVVEDPERAAWSGLQRDLASQGLQDAAAPFDPGKAAVGRDKKVLSREDLMSIQAAECAVQDAFGGPPPRDRRWSSVSFTTSKLTRQGEATLPFVAFRKSDHTADTLAFRRAIEAGNVPIDPLGLLRQLDNNVSWWLCKTYGFGDVSLQLGQCVSPDFWALVLAIDLIDRGTCDSVLVGGGQTIDQSSVLLCAPGRTPLPEADPRVGGAAVFFVLERAELVGPDQGYARVRLDLADGPRSAEPRGAREFGAPGLETALTLIRAVAALQSAAVGEGARGVGRAAEVGEGAILVDGLAQ